jgi:hypothetical protein
MVIQTFGGNVSNNQELLRAAIAATSTPAAMYFVRVVMAYSL